MTDFETTYEKSHKVSAIKTWWKKICKKALSILSRLLLPIRKIANKISKATEKRTAWNEERAEVFCNKYLPQICEKTEEGFWFYNGGYGFIYKCIKRNRKDYKFGLRNKVELFDYIKNKYEIEGYTKEVAPPAYGSYGTIEVDFIKNN